MTAPFAAGPLTPQDLSGAAPAPKGPLLLARPVEGGAPQMVRLLAQGTGHGGIEALVTGHNARGQLLLETPRGALLLESGPDLAVGSRVRLVPADVVARGATDEASAQAAARADPMLQALPRARADEPLAAVLMRLLARTKTPETTGGNPAERTESEPAAPLRQLTDGWRLLPLVLTGESDALVRVFRREEDEPGGEDRTDGRETGARLVLEVDWSRLGRTQLDLLVKGTRIDLKVRSEHSLGSEVARDIEQAFVAALETGGLVGTLSFVAPGLASMPDFGPMTDTIQA